ncbi:caspase family protein [Rhizobium sp. R693]|uniref:caspase family protein n=1 Tax=Rhizobium sp. R693 TaxID=1764276 RepID=UPI000B52FF63|nr:caspase family protein [Rhizobium sp. R693]OWV98764.1 hypothetical protein ATY79_19060 [Rhizobium sp. R693]
MSAFKKLRLYIWVFFYLLIFFEASFAERLAFVVGINDYPGKFRLVYPGNDAASIEAFLSRSANFNVTRVPKTDVGLLDLANAWDKFLATVKPNDEVVVYYSGHGVEFDGNNWIVPRDFLDGPAVASPTALSKRLLSVTNMMKELNNTSAKLTIWILDACRDNPFQDKGVKSIVQSGGMDNKAEYESTFVFYATRKGYASKDTLDGDPPNTMNSVFTRELLATLATPGQTAGTIAEKTTINVFNHSNHVQNPFYSSGMFEAWCFQPCPELAGAPAAPEGDIQLFPSGPTSLEDDLHLRGFGIDQADNLQPSARVGPIILAEAYNRHVGDSEASFGAAIKPTSNIVLLGRESALVAGCDFEPPSERFPFGCSVLRSSLGHDVGTVVNQDLVAKAPFNILGGFDPSMSSSPSSACVVDRRKSGTSITFKEVVVRNFENDKFVFGETANTSATCMGADDRSINP